MSIPQIYPTHNKYIYLPAVLKEYKSGWRIEYYVENPATKELVRKRIRTDNIVRRYRSKREARHHIAKMIEKINIQLANGWNVFYEDDNTRLYEKLGRVAELYLNEKRKELRLLSLFLNG